MPEAEALSALHEVFGDRPFRVKDMSASMVIDILTLGGDSIPGRFNNRMKLGVWLTQTGRAQPHKVEIVVPNTRGRPGTYRIRSN